MLGNNPTNRSDCGFTLLELMISIVIGVILVTIAVPSFSSFMTNQRVRGGAQDLYVGLEFARSEAIKRGEDVTVQPNDTNDWTQGWTISIDSSGNQLREHEGLEDVAISDSGTDLPDSVTYDGNGRTSDDAILVPFNVCDEASSGTVNQRVVEIGVSGRPRIERDGTCS